MRALSIAAMVFLSSTAAFAQQITNCEVYARTAVDQFNLNRATCRLAGPEWHDNFDNHRNWCRGVGSPQRWQQESDKRARALASCGAGAVADACRVYTESAINQYNENVRQKCSFNSPRWHRDAGLHMNWCINVSQAQRESEMRGRAQELASCGANARYCPWCPR